MSRRHGSRRASPPPSNGTNPSRLVASKGRVLHELRIENLLLIERAELRLARGLNAITGETGAGKTILAHSLDLLMGGKARPQIVRPGAEEAYVEGAFELPPGLLEDPELADLRERLPEGSDEIVLGRRIGSSGRTSAFVQGRSATAADLRALGSRLLGFYGQHEHRRLALGSAQLEVLDGFAGGDQLELRARYRAAHAEVLALDAELGELRDREGSSERELDLHRYELAEIEAAAPDPQEERELEAERERLRHAERLRDAAGGALAAISGVGDGGDADGARGLLGAGEAQLASASGVDGGLDELGEKVSAITVELDDVTSALRAYLDGLDGEPGRLDEVEDRLHALDRLKRKHGGSLEAVLAHADGCRLAIDRLENADRGRRLRRRALAGDARAHQPGARRRGGHPGVRRDRRRDRGEDRAGGGGEAQTHRLRAAGDLHHPSPAGGGAGRVELQDREARGRGPGTGDRRASRRRGAGRRDRPDARRRGSGRGGGAARARAARGRLSLPCQATRIRGLRAREARAPGPLRAFFASAGWVAANGRRFGARPGFRGGGPWPRGGLKRGIRDGLTSS